MCCFFTWLCLCQSVTLSVRTDVCRICLIRWANDGCVWSRSTWMAFPMCWYEMTMEGHRRLAIEEIIGVPQVNLNLLKQRNRGQEKGGFSMTSQQPSYRGDVKILTDSVLVCHFYASQARCCDNITYFGLLIEVVFSTSIQLQKEHHRFESSLTHCGSVSDIDDQLL